LSLNTTGELRPDNGKILFNSVSTQLEKRLEPNEPDDFAEHRPFTSANICRLEY
jgi:hypothetical protein